MDDKKREILVSSDPLPLEKTDPELAEHIRLIANRSHPVVRTLAIQAGQIVILKHDNTRKVISLVGRNDPCSCGSEKKFKKCCGR